MAVLNPSAMLIVLGGTFGAMMAGTSLAAIKTIPSLYKKAFSSEPPDLNGARHRARRLRRAGAPRRPPGARRAAREIEDPYTRKGLQLVVDGTDPDLVAEVLEAENDAMRKRHAAVDAAVREGRRLRADDGHHRHGLRPRPRAQNLSKPETLGPSISAAFIATLLGVASANVVYLPIAARLKQLSQEELHFRAMTLEGILAIQAGDNPRVVAEKLIAYVPPARAPDRGGGGRRRCRRRRPRRPRPPSTMSGRRRHKGGHDGGGARERGALARLVRGHDHAAVRLFMVLFAISSVNTSKFEALQKALENAFSGKILSGGEAVMETGNDKQPEEPGRRAAAAGA